MHQIRSIGFCTEIAREEDCSHLDLSWKNFFRDPSRWWDNRNSKRSSWQPDFQHKVTKQALWMDSCQYPSWVKDDHINREFVVPTANTLSNGEAISPSLIWGCCKSKDLLRGTKLHQELRKWGLAEKDYSDALITMYAKCGELEKAHALLDMHSSSTSIPWNALIAGYIRQGQCQKALDCFEQMQHESIAPTAITYACILKAYAVTGAINKGKQIHDEILRQGLLQDHNVVLGSALVDMYAKCGAFPQAQDVLEKLPSRNVSCWNALIVGYVQNGQGQHALHCFEQMQVDGVPADPVTYACILKACASVRAINKGKQIHDELLRQGLLLKDDVVLGGALVHMYAKCGALVQAQDVLQNLPSRDVVCWSTLIAGYAQNGEGQQALHCFELMQADDVTPDAVTYACIIKACASVGDINKGKHIHDELLRKGLVVERDIVLGGALVDMYVKCGALSQAHDVLEKLHFRDVVCWSSLIAGYAQNGQGQQAEHCFEQMQTDGIRPNVVTYAGILKAYASIGAMNKGKLIHDEVLRQGLLLEHNVLLGGALVDMYAKCGALLQAQIVLEKLPSRSVICWNALISAYAQAGQEKEVFECYERMWDEDILPDRVSFLCLLNLCSHLGLVEKGQELLDVMEAMYGWKPSIECFTCMTDLFGRAGHLRKAVELIRGMPFAANCSTWRALLGACQKWVDFTVGSSAFEQVLEVDKCDAAVYVLMANIYAAAGMPEKAKNVEAMRTKNKALNLQGCSSWVESNNMLHE